MNRKLKAYGLCNESIKQMSQTEKKILASIIKIELERNSLRLEDLDLDRFPEEQRELIHALLNERD